MACDKLLCWQLVKEILHAKGSTLLKRTFKTVGLCFTRCFSIPVFKNLLPCSSGYITSQRKHKISQRKSFSLSYDTPLQLSWRLSWTNNWLMCEGGQLIRLFGLGLSYKSWPACSLCFSLPVAYIHPASLSLYLHHLHSTLTTNPCTADITDLHTTHSCMFTFSLINYISFR